VRFWFSEYNDNYSNERCKKVMRGVKKYKSIKNQALFNLENYDFFNMICSFSISCIFLKNS